MDRIVEQVMEKFRSRSEIGIKKYNTTLEQNNKDDYFNHLLEELMDACNYIMKLKDIVNSHPNDEELGKFIRKMVKQ